jgi:uncharacterized membrane protein
MIRSAGGIVSSLLLIAYPGAMWVGVTMFGARVAGWGVLAGLVVLAVAGLRGDRPSGRMGAVLGRLALAAVVGLGILIDEERFLRMIPVLINATLLVVFGRSLLGGRVTMVEQFARASGEEPSQNEVAYYRTVTAIWCWFFLANGLVTLWLVLFGSLAAWGIYTGMIAYVLMGLLTASLSPQAA